MTAKDKKSEAKPVDRITILNLKGPKAQKAELDRAAKATRLSISMIGRIALEDWMIKHGFDHTVFDPKAAT